MPNDIEALEEFDRGLKADREDLLKRAFDAFGSFDHDPELLKIMDEWPEPTPFDTPGQPPEYPLEALPARMAAFVEALSVSTQTDPAMGATLGLGVLATAFQRRFNLQVTPDWAEPLSLFLACIAQPGERKSAVMSAMLSPVFAYEGERREREAVKIAQNQTERELLERRLQSAKISAAKKASSYEQFKHEALDLTAELSEFKTRYPYRAVCDDATPERLVAMMDEQGGAITMASAEGGLFDIISSGRYDSGSGSLDVLLKGHAGDPIIIDRIGRSGNRIENPRLTIELCVQPLVVNGLLTNPTFRGKGLTGRFLYAPCKSKLGHREITPDPVPENIKANYIEFVREILDDESKGTITLSPEAEAQRIEFQADVEKKLNDELSSLADFASKLTGQMLRVAALIHAAECVTDPAQTPISGETMAAAIKIGDYYREAGRIAFAEMGADREESDARYMLKKFISADTYRLTMRDLKRLCRARFKRDDDAEAALNVLKDLNYVREETEQTGGRPTRKIYLNPRTKASKGTKGI